MKEKIEEKEKEMIKTLNNHKADTKDQFEELNENIKDLEQVRFFK